MGEVDGHEAFGAEPFGRKAKQTGVEYQCFFFFFLVVSVSCNKSSAVLGHFLCLFYCSRGLDFFLSVPSFSCNVKRGMYWRVLGGGDGWRASEKGWSFHRRGWVQCPGGSGSREEIPHGQYSHGVDFDSFVFLQLQPRFAVHGSSVLSYSWSPGKLSRLVYLLALTLRFLLLLCLLPWRRS